MTPPRLALILLVLVAALGVSHATPYAASGEVVAPVVDECWDEIDNDGDGTIDALGFPDYENEDEGCDDDTPKSEALTRAPTLLHDDAVEAAEDALYDAYGGRYENAEDDWMSCWRVSRVRTTCRFGFARRLFLYSGEIRLHSYVAGESSFLSDKRVRYWRKREPRLKGADEVTILKCNRRSCSMRLTYYL